LGAGAGDGSPSSIDLALLQAARRKYLPPSRSKGFRDTIDILLSYPVLTGFWEYVYMIAELRYRDDAKVDMYEVRAYDRWYGTRRSRFPVISLSPFLVELPPFHRHPSVQDIQ